MQADSNDLIRTQATLSLTKVASLLDSTLASKFLLSAYCKALQDTYCDCKIAALEGLLSIIVLFSSKELTHSIIPSICPLLIDEFLQVRNLAFVTAERSLAILKNASSKLPSVSSSTIIQSKSISNNSEQSTITLNSSPVKQEDTKTAKPLILKKQTKPKNVLPSKSITVHSFTDDSQDSTRSDDGWNDINFSESSLDTLSESSQSVLPSFNEFNPWK